MSSICIFEETLEKVVELKDVISSADYLYNKKSLAELPVSERQSFRALIEECRDLIADVNIDNN